MASQRSDEILGASVLSSCAVPGGMQEICVLPWSSSTDGSAGRAPRVTQSGCVTSRSSLGKANRAQAEGEEMPLCKGGERGSPGCTAPSLDGAPSQASVSLVPTAALVLAGCHGHRAW